MSVQPQQETLSFQTEVKQLLHLVVHSLYSNKEIFLRELISNASDAADKLRFEAISDSALYEGDAELKVYITFDDKARTITLKDNGIGMSRDEVIENLGTIAKSGTKDFLAQLTGDQKKDAHLIGQFGVGFYSAFIIADKVTVVTRRAGLTAEHGVLWESTGSGDYTIENVEKNSHGTEITLHLKEGEDDFLNAWRLRTIITKYSDHVNLPIFMHKIEDAKTESAPSEPEWETVNRATALWTLPKSAIKDEEYKEYYKQMAHDFEDPLMWVHNQVEGGNLDYISLLYLPARASMDFWQREQQHGLKLYVQRVFIMDQVAQFIPHYLRFMRGIVDTNALPLNISREILQDNPVIPRLRAALVKSTLDMLDKLAVDEPEKYTQFWKQFGNVLKEGPAEDFANRDRVAKLLRFTSTHSDSVEQTTSFDDYVKRMKPEQKKIYYITADNFNTAKSSPHLEIFRKKDIEVILLSDRIAGDKSKLQLRDGFQLTDPRMTARGVQDEVNYCIYCHDNDGDFCSKGFPVKKNEPDLGFKKNPLDLILTGCPLEEKISEMNFLKRDGHTLASLAMVMVDNPMCPATGHRICNDCMKSCIYQKQDPVNIPEIETRVLTDVLDLPWGVEIYDLLTRWNPLRQKQWVMKPYNNLKVMIAGMGPAGFTLAHHLLLEGFAVVGFDGLKIEPLPEKYIKEPIYQFKEMVESLDERLMAGFGGVAEYGITVRWDKNFLKLIYISLMRKPYFQVFGSTRFGGTILLDDAWEMGFDHFVVAVGAGLPKALNIPGSLAPGMRQANDFLMALQLGNAAKSNSITNLQVRLPAAVIGGGLTGVDTATEVQAYYITQVEKNLKRYEELVNAYGENSILEELDHSSKEILEEFLMHGKAVRKERERAAEKLEKPNFIKLIRQWGGVTIVYRRIMQESPAYINNHEELQKAFEEGIYYLEALEPAAVHLNLFGLSETLVCHRRQKNNEGEWVSTDEEVNIPARSIFVATGTQPNIAYEFEHRGTFNRVGLQYQHYEEINNELTVAHGVDHCKDPQFGPFTSYNKHDHRVSLIGDTHPVFHGNVVKAIASGMRTYPKILNILQDRLGQQGDDNEYRLFANKMSHLFDAKVKKIERKAKNIVELTIQAPLAAKHYKPGHFYRLQNYETFAPRIQQTTLQMEPLALVAAGCDRHSGTLKFIVIEKGVSSTLCSLLQEGEPVSLMGPTGTRAKISSEHETVLIVGNELSLPLLLTYGPALRQAGNQVIYLSLFNIADEVYSKDLIEQAADVFITSSKSNMIDDLLKYALDNPIIPLHDIDRVYLIADTCSLKDFQKARKVQLKEFLSKNPPVQASVYSTMQCMLKGVCAQCLQWQIDPETGKRTKAIFACSWPEQPLEMIDIDNIDERQGQNRLQETMSRMWVKHLLTNFKQTKK